MDGLPEIPTPESLKPQVQIFKMSFFQTIWAKILLLILVLTLIASILYFLSSQGLLKLSFFEKQANKLSQNIVSSPLPLEKLQITCPVPKEFCKQGKIIKDGDKILGIGYKLPVGTKIYAGFTGKAFPSGIEDKAKGIINHAIITLGGTGQYQGYTMTYEYFGLPGKDINSQAVKQNDELGALWGGSFPDKSPYNGINILVYLKDSQDNLVPMEPTQLISP